MSEGGSDQPDLLSDLSDLDFVRHLLAEMHDDLLGKVSRLRMLTGSRPRDGAERDLMELGNPLSHFRHVHDATNLDAGRSTRVRTPWA